MIKIALKSRDKEDETEGNFRSSHLKYKKNQIL